MAPESGLVDGGRGELKVPVRIIFNNDDVVFAGEGVDLLSPLDSQDTACGVVSHTGEQLAIGPSSGQLLSSTHVTV